MLISTFNLLKPFILDVTQYQGAISTALEQVTFQHEIFNGFYLDYSNCPLKQFYDPLENGDAYANGLQIYQLDSFLAVLGHILYCWGSFYIIVDARNSPELKFNIAMLDDPNLSNPPQNFRAHLVKSSVQAYQETGLPYLIDGFTLTSQANIAFTQAYTSLNLQQYIKSTALLQSAASKMGLVPMQQSQHHYTFEQSYKTRLINDVKRVFDTYILNEIKTENSLQCIPQLKY